MFARDGGRKRQARQDPSPFDVHRTGATLAVVAAFLGARQLKVFAKRVEQRDARIDLQMCPDAVDGEDDLARTICSGERIGGVDG